MDGKEWEKKKESFEVIISLVSGKRCWGRATPSGDKRAGESVCR